MLICMGAFAVTFIKTIIVHCNVKRYSFFSFTSWYVLMRNLLTPPFSCVWPMEQEIIRIKSAISQFLFSVKQLHTDRSFKFDSLGEFFICKANMLWLLALSKFSHCTIYVCLFTLFHFTGGMCALKYSATWPQDQRILVLKIT